MRTFKALVDQVGDGVFQTVSEYMEEMMGGPFDQESHSAQAVLQERVLVQLLKKFKPEGVIFVEDEPKEVLYGVYNPNSQWICDASGSTITELELAVMDALGEPDLLFPASAELGMPVIKFINNNDYEYSLRILGRV